jgi:hypothetical protein
MKNNFVKENESPALIIEDGDLTYLCFPDYGVPTGSTGKEMKKWAVKKIDESTSGTTVITWAGGNTSKVNAVNDFSALTFKYLV